VAPVASGVFFVERWRRSRSFAVIARAPIGLRPRVILMLFSLWNFVS
jgi:hypothetical protein